jgi:poly(A) polymerase
MELLRDDIVEKLGQAFARSGKSLYLVGGTIRDALLERPSPDIDLTTDAVPAEVKDLIAAAGPSAVYAVGERYGTIGAIFNGTTVEITTFRGETYREGYRKPKVRFGVSLVEDLSRRDFTINAIAQNTATGELIDPFHGQDDLRRRIIRAVGDADERFKEDPLRMMRAVRFASELGFHLEKHTAASVKRNAQWLQSISVERIAAELNRILVSPHPSLGIRMLCDLNLMEWIIPEILDLRGLAQVGYRTKDVFEHTLAVVEGVPASLDLRLAALLHDIGKPATVSHVDGEVHFFAHEIVGAEMAERILRRLHFDNKRIAHVSKLVREHMRVNTYVPTWTDSAVRRFVRETGDLLDETFALSRGDITSRRAQRVREALARVNELEARSREMIARQAVAPLRSPLNGHELMEMFGRGPGPWIGQIQRRLLEMVLEGELAPDDKETAATIARQMVESGI